tara:strand:+ start:1673 stop:2677 length:1005 start_codon:yes stop_codon:yes gene_type:complete
MYYVTKKISIKNFIKNYDRKSKNIVYVSFIKGTFSNEIFLWEMSTIYFLIKNNLKFRIKYNFDSIKNSIFLWSPSESIFKKKIKNYSLSIISTAEELERNFNKVYPPSSDLKFWENKSYMYKELERKKILHPKTKIFPTKLSLQKNLTFPLLLKGEYSSGSKDIHKFESMDDLSYFLKTSDFKEKFDNYIFQSLLNIKKDLRVTIVNQKVVLSYWRINPHDEWRPTASSHGSYIDFENYPSKWNNYFIETTKILDLKMAAFDFAWENDDFSSIPYLLEVSPRFSPNPVFKNENFSYGKWKKKLFLKKSYPKLQTDLIFNINEEYLSSYSDKFEK